MKQPSASIAIQVLPGVANADLIPIVDKVIEYIKSTGLNVYVGPFETTIEGEFDALWEIARKCQLICIAEGAPSVMSYIKFAYNPSDGVWSIDDKVAKHHQ